MRKGFDSLCAVVTEQLAEAVADIGLTQIKGLDSQVDEVVRTLDVFLGYATFRDELGGTPRRAGAEL